MLGRAVPGTRASTDAMYNNPAHDMGHLAGQRSTRMHAWTFCHTMRAPRVFGERPLVLSVNRFPMSFASAVSLLYITSNHVLPFVHAAFLSEMAAVVAAASCFVKIDRHSVGVGAHVASLAEFLFVVWPIVHLPAVRIGQHATNFKTAFGDSSGC